MEYTHTFSFGGKKSRVIIGEAFPGPETIAFDLGIDIPPGGKAPFLLVCDRNTEGFARSFGQASVVVLPPGEGEKNWASVEAILAGAREAGLGRDGVFIGMGGGVVTDLTAFAASLYMRGASLVLVSTTLLGMADAALGGKTGIDLFGMKNLAGTFYPADLVYMPLASLASLPDGEWKSGMAEIIKTAVLDRALFNLLKTAAKTGGKAGLSPEALAGLISASALVKGHIVEDDPRETGTRRMLLNLGHTFGHALESSAGLGALSHGEAVAWGLARAAEMGVQAGVTPRSRAAEITGLLDCYGYETRTPHPLSPDLVQYRAALEGDKKKKRGGLVFVVPARESACLYPAPDSAILNALLLGEYRL